VNELLLYTTDASKAHAEIERSGGQVRQVFTPHVFVAAVPDDAALSSSSLEAPADLDEVSRMMAEAWKSRASKPKSRGEPIPWDTPGFEPPC